MWVFFSLLWSLGEKIFENNFENRIFKLYLHTQLGNGVL